MMRREEIYQGVVDVLGEVLKVGGSEISESSRLGEDLGAEYLDGDYANIVFGLRNKFRVDITPEAPIFIRHSLSFFDRPGFYSSKDGLTELGVRNFRKEFLYIDPDKVRQGASMEELWSLDTVGSTVTSVEQRLEAAA